jgi:hypothetical protein
MFELPVFLSTEQRDSVHHAGLLTFVFFAHYFTGYSTVVHADAMLILS